MIKNKKQGGFIDRQRKGVGVGEEENRRSLFFVLARALLSPMFSKRTKSKKKKQRLGTDYSLFERQFELKSIRKDPDSKIVTEVGRSKFSRRGNNLTMVVFTVEHK